MTKVLADLLGIQDPSFQLGLRKLEANAGRPNHDIRLASTVTQGMQLKLRDLGLLHQDTTGRELYMMLAERLKVDELKLNQALKGASGGSDDPITHIALALTRELCGQQCFALKLPVARKMLKANVPKRTMKALGYRSADSMLKQESVASIYAAAWLIEGEIWSKRMLAAHTKLQPTEFESRKIAIDHPGSQRWHNLAASVVARKKHNVMALKNLGTVVLLPMPANRPPLATLTTTVLALHAVNEVQAASTLLKLHQVRPGFGAMVQDVLKGEVFLESPALGRPLSWRIIQQYYARAQDSIKTELFEPLVQPEDLKWHSPEAVLARIQPSLAFWTGTSHLALLRDGEATSCNLTDSLLSHCNQLPYHMRLKGHFRTSLRTELLLGYLGAAQLEQTILQGMQPKLAAETAVI